MVNLSFKNTDITKELQGFIDIADNDTFVFPSGKFIISEKIQVKNKTNLKLLGSKTTLVSVFDPKTGFDTYKGVFNFVGCKNTTLENFVFDTTKPATSAGTVIAKDLEARTVDVKMFDDCGLDGSQTAFAIDSVDEDGTPDMLFKTWGGTPYEMIGDGIARIFPKPTDRLSAERVSRIPIGARLCFRHGLGSYKTLENSAVTFSDCDDTLLKDVTVNSSAGFMFVVFPRCNNFTIINYRMECPQGSNRLMTSNIDAIHLLGLTGKLTVKDCYFSGIGDDVLNIHSTAAFVNGIEDDKFTVINKRFEMPMEVNWCQKGDILRAYNSDFIEKGNARVVDYKDSVARLDVIDGSVEVGDVLANTAYFATAEIINCEVRNSRARAFLFQTENILVKDCKIFGTTSPGMIFAPDIEKWHEVGPIKNATVENCVFEKCGWAKVGLVNGAITVRVSHTSSNDVFPAGVHQNITLKNNKFINIPVNSIYAMSVDGLHIEGNTLDGEPLKPENIEIINCKDVKVDVE